ncbi:hypothetical protein Val02_39010 [Virgisporangium aliadipatigenens]|uniref:Uncharacterized protein n=1 Tax=Virgisporangium aliadipatigenens TaxID=741659 RepID=A0A8J3YNB0_9ACTN|nr:hypothetical protein [Virgisporangium aliadipatigenens]GIJ47015.1 hypothetical protein Val02_39010 [Virgisporangium aliadipatigenens]
MTVAIVVGVGLLVLALLLMAWIDVRTRPREPRRRRTYDDSGGLTVSGTDYTSGDSGSSSGF